MKKIIKMTKILMTILLILSQLSLPLNVLAEELEEFEVDNYEITINETKLTENNFDVETTKQITITQNYLGEDNYIFAPLKTLEIDYTNRLYGQYNYQLSVSNESELLETKNITINHIGNNNDIINPNNIYYINNTYYILGDITKELTTLDIITKFNNNLTDYNSILEIYDNENNKLQDTDIVEDNDKLYLKATYNDYDEINEIEEYYNLIIVEDNNEDEVIDNKDLQKELIQEILNNKEEILPFNIIDITNLLLEEVKEESLDNLITTFEYNNNLFVNEELVLNYYIEGFNQEVLKGIEGKLNYDKNILELIDIEINSIDGCFNEENKFLYLLDDFKENGLLMTFKFKALSVGTTEITIDNIIASTGALEKANLNDDKFSAEINVLELGIGGDEDEDGEQDEEDETLIPTIPEVEEEPKEEIITNTTGENKRPIIKPILLSGDNFIKSLTIKGYELAFDKDTLEYELKVKNNVKSLEFDIELNDNNASFEIFGNENFKSGKNTVEIKVTAENGNTKTYSIVVNKESKEVIEEETETTKSNSKGIIIFLIVLVIIGLVYVIFKDEDDK